MQGKHKETDVFPDMNVSRLRSHLVREHTNHVVTFISYFSQSENIIHYKTMFNYFKNISFIHTSFKPH